MTKTGDRLNVLLAEKGMTRADLSRRAGVAYRTVYNVAAGGKPHPDVAGKLADALGTTPEYLLTGGGERVVQEGKTIYETSDERKERDNVNTVAGAIRFLAKQLGVEEETLRRVVMDCAGGRSVGEKEGGP